VDYTFTLISAYKTPTLFVCVCLSVVFPNCSQNLQPQGNDDHSLERFSLFSTHLQGATLSFSLKMWARALVLNSTASIAFVLTFF
jgi:hypothetical protein